MEGFELSKITGTEPPLLTEEEKQNIEAQKNEYRAFYAGKICGIEQFAWWKDGIQYVGTTGKMLKQAIAEETEKLNKSLEALK